MLILFPRYIEIVNSYLHHSSLKQATKKEKQGIANEPPTILGKFSHLDLPKGFNLTAAKITAVLSFFHN